MNRTEFVTEILKLTGYKRSLHPDVNFGIQRLLDKYEKGLKAGQHETIVIAPDLVKGLEAKIRDCDDDLDEVGWGYQKGIIISRRDAINIVSALKEKGQ